MKNPMEKKNWDDWKGIAPLPDDRGYVPYELFDEVFPYIDNLAELKVILYIVRRTVTFKKTEDWIAKCQFESGMVDKGTGEEINPGTGLSRPSIDKGIRLAVQHGIIRERIECSHCGHELQRQEEYRTREDKKVLHLRVPTECSGCGIGTQTKMRYYYQLTYRLTI